MRECAELQDEITARRRSALVGTTTKVLVEGYGSARSTREAPEIDGVIAVPGTLQIGSFFDVTITESTGPDLRAVPIGAR
jgi:ribosomal protein S12 methylthiotransferase